MDKFDKSLNLTYSSDIAILGMETFLAFKHTWASVALFKHDRTVQIKMCYLWYIWHLVHERERDMRHCVSS